MRILFRYYVDCRNLIGKVPAFNFFKAPSETHLSAGEAAWGKMHPDLPFHINYDSFDTAVVDMLESLSSALKISPTATPEEALRSVPASSLSYNLEDAAQRQKDFFYQVALPHYRDAQFIESAINRCCPSQPRPQLSPSPYSIGLPCIARACHTLNVHPSLRVSCNMHDLQILNYGGVCKGGRCAGTQHFC